MQQLYYPSQRVQLASHTVRFPWQPEPGARGIIVRQDGLQPDDYLIYFPALGGCTRYRSHEMKDAAGNSISLTSWYIAVLKDRKYPRMHHNLH